MIHQNVAGLQNVHVSPYIFSNSKFVGGIAADVIPPYARMPTGATFRDEPAIPSAVAPTLAGRYLYAGPLWNHFGHILTDSIHRLWALRGTDVSYDGILFPAVKGLRGVNTDEDLEKMAVPGLISEIIELLDMPKLPIVLLKAPATVEFLDVPELGTAAKMQIPAFYREHLAAYQTTLSDKLAPYIRKAPPKVYFCRNHLFRDGGVLGSSYFERVLCNAGFVSATPEETSFRLQLANLLGAKTVVFDAGSAVHPTDLFNQVDTDYFMFPRRDADRVFRAALLQRARFNNLCEDGNIVLMPDRLGNLNSPACVVAYRDPVPVYDKLLRHGLVSEPFDKAEFIASEMSDLRRSPASSKELQARRIEQLTDLRK